MGVVVHLGILSVQDEVICYSQFQVKFKTGSLPKTVLVGAAATLADMATLGILVQFLNYSPQIANLPSLIVGSFIQFIGNRYVSFHGAKEGNASKQMLGFFLAELAALALNAGIFYALITWTSLNYALARPLGSLAVFFGLSYPAWIYIFGSHRRKTS